MENYLGLFLSALLAATIIPFSSEVLLVGMLASEDFSAWGLLFAASVGNTLGSVINWGLGRYCQHWKNHRWFPVTQRQLDRASQYFIRYGVWSLLLAWVPVIGDPITFAAGVLGVRFPVFLVLVAISKTGRYLAILAVTA